jgi:hypothetical protein
MQKNTENTENTNVNLAALQDMTTEELLGKASALGLTVKEDANHTDVLDAIVEAVQAEDATNETTHGTILSIRTTFDDAQKSEDAKSLVTTARDRILQAQRQKNYTTMFLADKNGKHYTQRAPYIRMKPETVQRVLDLVTLLPDGSQDQLVADFKAAPEQFNEPVLVLVTRRLGEQFRPFVMLYIDRKVSKKVDLSL